MDLVWVCLGRFCLMLLFHFFDIVCVLEVDSHLLAHYMNCVCVFSLSLSLCFPLLSLFMCVCSFYITSRWVVGGGGILESPCLSL